MRSTAAYYATKTEKTCSVPELNYFKMYYDKDVFASYSKNNRAQKSYRKDLIRFPVFLIYFSLLV